MAASSSSSYYNAIEVLGYTLQHPWEGCRLSSRPIPSPGPGHILLRVLCTPVNPSDVLSIQGLYDGWRPKSFPAVPGLEGMGVIAQLGDNVSNVAIGQRVFAFSDQGFWQEYIVVPATHVVPLPDSISNEVAAQFLVNPVTVVGLFRTLDAPKGEYIIQTAAASVLGRMAIQYAHHIGVKTINFVRRDEQIEELKALGADEVINTNDGNIVEKVRQITAGKLAYGAIECVGGELTKVVVESIRDEGTVLVYGLLSSNHAEVGISDLLFRGVKVHGFWLSPWLKKLPPSEFQEIVGYVISLLSQKVIDPLVGEKFKFDQFEAAIKKSLEPQRGGKVLLVNN